MTPRLAYEAALTTAKKQLGGLTPGLDKAARTYLFNELYKPLSGKRGYSERNVEALNKRINKYKNMSDRQRAAFEKKLHEAEYETEYARDQIDNILAELKAYSEDIATTPKARIIQKEIYDFFYDFVKKQEKILGPIKVAEILSNATRELKATMTRLIYIMYKEGGYRESDGKIDITKWEADMLDIVGALGGSYADMSTIKSRINELLDYNASMSAKRVKKGGIGVWQKV